MAFYATLPSNGSRYFPDNKATNYKIKLLEKVIVAPNSYEVALTELTYICSLRTFTGSNEDNLIEFTGKTGGFIDLPLLHYSSIDHLVHAVNQEFEKHGVPCSLFHSNVKCRISLEVGTGYAISISEKLSDILGFDGETQFDSEEPNETQSPTFFYGRFRPDILGGRYHIFIYCDIIDSQIVGSALVPLLRMVNIIGNEGQAITQTFSTPFYHRVSRSEFDTISILLCDEFGEELPIDKGQVTLTLHFRKIGNNGE